MPVPIILGLILLGTVLLMLHRRRFGLSLLALGTVLLFALAIRPVAVLVAQPLEFAYPAYSQAPVQYVVVLGSGHHTDDRIPVLNQLTQTAMFRLMTGIEIYRNNPGARLLLSGYGGRDERSHAEVAADFAMQMGVDARDISLAPDAMDTADEAHAWKALLKDQPFALVTSAMHMPRAMYLFDETGLNAIPAPADYKTGGSTAPYWRDWLPSAHHLSTVEAAWHEYLGLTWAKLRSTN